MPLIPTASKDRLPEGFTYPWGAQAISTALEGVPGLEEARLWFSWRDEFWASEWRQKIAELGEITLLEVGPSYLGGGVDVRANAVPSEYSMAARERLISESPKLRSTLAAGSGPRGRPRPSIKLHLATAARNPPRE
jgi:hypothetical protein